MARTMAARRVNHGETTVDWTGRGLYWDMAETDQAELVPVVTLLVNKPTQSTKLQVNVQNLT